MAYGVEVPTAQKSPRKTVESGKHWEIRWSNGNIADQLQDNFTHMNYLIKDTCINVCKIRFFIVFLLFTVCSDKVTDK